MDAYTLRLWDVTVHNRSNTLAKRSLSQTTRQKQVHYLNRLESHTTLRTTPQLPGFVGSAWESQINLHTTCKRKRVGCCLRRSFVANKKRKNTRNELMNGPWQNFAHALVSDRIFVTRRWIYICVPTWCSLNFSP